MPLLLAQLPSEDTLQRLVDVLTDAEVAREPGVFVYVIDDDGHHERILTEDLR